MQSPGREKLAPMSSASSGDAMSSDEAEADFWKTLELTGEKWLTHPEIVELLTTRGSMSVGAADAIVDTLRAAFFANKPTGVRWHWFHDTDFLTNKPNRGNTRASEADVIYWLDQKFPNNPNTENRRYADDEALVAEAVKGIDSKMYANAHQAARALAPRAQGTESAAIDRLGRKISARLKSRKSPKTRTIH